MKGNDIIIIIIMVIFKCYFSGELIALTYKIFKIMACKRCEISTYIKDNGVDLFFVTETWLSAHGDEAKTAELAPSGFDVKSFPRQSRSRGGGIATVIIIIIMVIFKCYFSGELIALT